jgi:ferrous iron transport protein A
MPTQFPVPTIEDSNMRGLSQASCGVEDEACLLPLTLLRAGQSGRIGSVVGPEDWVHRLRELGLRDEAEVRMVRPGSPCVIKLGGQTLCFRGDESTRVLVRVGAVAS